MKLSKMLLTGLFLLSVTLLLTPISQAQTCDSTNSNFVDLNGDGFNDNAPDADGDGIPNGLDPDYIKHAQDGTGLQKGKLLQKGNATAIKSMSKFQKMQRFGRNSTSPMMSRTKRTSAGSQSAGNGTGVCDGSGPGSGSAVCDGTGPKGPHGRGGR